MGRLIKKILFLFSSFIIISCEQAVYNGSPDEPTVQNRKLFIQSKPSHATIYLNGKNMGIYTPDTVKWLAIDNSFVTLKLPMYSDTTFSINVPVGQAKNVYVDFTANTKNVGTIGCSSDPNGADIWINDSLTNRKTPFILNRLTPGYYKVKFTSFQHRPDSINVTVVAGTTADVHLTLEDTSKWVSYNKNNSHIVSNYVSSIACDKQNNIWLGTEMGLMKFNGKKFETYTRFNSPLQSDYITSIASDEQNEKWIGTAGGLMFFNNVIWTDYSSKLPSPNVTAIIFDHIGNGWIGTYNGLVEYSNGSWKTLTTVNSGLKENFITCLAVDNLNRIWIGSLSHGISVYDGLSWQYFNSSNINIKNQSLDYVQAITIDKTNKVWVSVLNVTLNRTQIITYDGTRWSLFTDPAFLYNLTYNLFSREQFVFFGNTYGLCILNTDSNVFSFYQKANSALPLFKIQTITMDNSNNVWIGTFMNGVGKLKKGNF